MNFFNPKIYWETRLATNPGLQGVGYTSLGEGYNQWLYRLRRRMFLEEAGSLRLDWARSSVLDIGSGTGFYVRLWQEIGVRSIMGSDLTEYAVASLQKKFARNEFFQLDIGAPLALREQFDVISAMDVLFHIIDDRRYEAAIFNVHSLLNPGGWFILTDNFLHATADRAVHQVSRSLNEVTSILERTGFQIIRRKPMFVLMNYPIDAKRQIWKSSWKILMYPARKNAFFAYLLGAGLYPIESALTRLFHEGPSTELMICRKRDPGTPGRSYAY